MELDNAKNKHARESIHDAEHAVGAGEIVRCEYCGTSIRCYHGAMTIYVSHGNSFMNRFCCSNSIRAKVQYLGRRVGNERDLRGSIVIFSAHGVGPLNCEREGEAEGAKEFEEC